MSRFVFLFFFILSFNLFGNECLESDKSDWHDCTGTYKDNHPAGEKYSNYYSGYWINGILREGVKTINLAHDFKPKRYSDYSRKKYSKYYYIHNQYWDGFAKNNKSERYFVRVFYGGWENGLKFDSDRGGKSYSEDGKLPLYLFNVTQAPKNGKDNICFVRVGDSFQNICKSERIGRWNSDGRPCGKMIIKKGPTSLDFFKMLYEAELIRSCKIKNEFDIIEDSTIEIDKSHEFTSPTVFVRKGVIYNEENIFLYKESCSGRFRNSFLLRMSLPTKNGPSFDKEDLRRSALLSGRDIDKPKMDKCPCRCDDPIGIFKKEVVSLRAILSKAQYKDNKVYPYKKYEHQYEKCDEY